MVVHDKIYIEIVNSGESAEELMERVWTNNPALVGVRLIDNKLEIESYDALGESTVHLLDKSGKEQTIEVVVDDFEYYYYGLVNDEKVNENNPAKMYYLENDPTNYIQIKEKVWSTLYKRYLDYSETQHQQFTYNITYSGENISASPHNKDFVRVDALKPKAEGSISLDIQSANNKIHTLSFDVFIVDGRTLSVLPKDPIVLNGFNTGTQKAWIGGTNDDLIVDAPNTDSFEIVNIDNESKSIEFKALKPDDGKEITVSSYTNGNLKTVTFTVLVKPFPLESYTKRHHINIGDVKQIPVMRVIGDLELRDKNSTALNKCNYWIDYDRDRKSAIINVKPIEKQQGAEFIISDVVEGRIWSREHTLKLDFVELISAKLVSDPNKIKALELPAKIKFTRASNSVEAIAVSNIDKANIRTKVEYDINPYNDETIYESGHVYVYPPISDDITVRINDGVGYDQVNFKVKPSDKELFKWIAVIDKDKKSTSVGSFQGETAYTKKPVNSGDFVGTTWIKDHKYGKHIIKSFLYKVKKPSESTQTTVEWIKSLSNSSPEVTVSVRDGFVLENTGKNYTLTAKHKYENVFEVDCSDKEIIFENAETVLFTDNQNQVEVIQNIEENGVLISLDENGNETAGSLLSLEPSVVWNIGTLVYPKKIPISKPMNCEDLKRLKPDEINETDKFKIYPSLDSNDSVKVYCRFEKGSDGEEKTWTIIPSESISRFTNIVGRTWAEDGTKIDTVKSVDGVRPEYFPNGSNSSESPSFLSYEFPFKIKNLSYNLTTSNKTDRSISSFKFLTDTSEIWHIEGPDNSNKMETRQGRVIDYDQDKIKSSLGQVVDLPDTISGFEWSENNTNGVINLEKPSDRLIVMNAGSEQDFDISQTFLSELSFVSIFNEDNITRDPWMDTNLLDPDIKLSLNISTAKHAYIVSHYKTSEADLIPDYKIKTDTTEIITNIAGEELDLSEWVNVSSDSKIWNVSILDSIPHTFDVETKLTPESKIESSVDTDWIVSSKLTNTVMDIELNNSLSSDTNNILSEKESYTYDVDEINDLSSITHPLIVSYDPNDFSTVTFVETQSYKNQASFSWNVSWLDTEPKDISSFVTASSTGKLNYIVSSLESNLNTIPITLEKNSDINSIPHLKESPVMDLEEFVNVVDDMKEVYNVSNVDSTPAEFVTDTYKDAYHPVNIAMKETTVEQDITNYDLNPNAKHIPTLHTPKTWTIETGSELISFAKNVIVQRETNVIQAKANADVVGRIEPYPAIVYQDGHKNYVYDDFSEISFGDILNYKPQEYDIVTQMYNDNTNDSVTNLNFNRSENHILESFERKFLEKPGVINAPLVTDFEIRSIIPVSTTDYYTPEFINELIKYPDASKHLSNTYFVGLNGNNNNPGTVDKPLANVGGAPDYSNVIILPGKYTGMHGWGFTSAPNVFRGGGYKKNIYGAGDATRIVISESKWRDQCIIVQNFKSSSFFNIWFDRITYDNGYNTYSAAIVRYAAYIKISDCKFTATNDYSMFYWNDHFSKVRPEYYNCSFTGERKYRDGFHEYSYSLKEFKNFDNTVDNISYEIYDNSIELINASNSKMFLEINYDEKIAALNLNSIPVMNYSGLETDIVNQSNNPENTIDFTSVMSYSGLETDIINQTNDPKNTIDFISVMNYSGLETDIVNQTDTDSEIGLDINNLYYQGIQSKITTQKPVSIINTLDTPNTDNKISELDRVYIVGQKAKRIPQINDSQGIAVLDTNTHVVEQKQIQVPQIDTRSVISGKRSEILVPENLYTVGYDELIDPSKETYYVTTWKQPDNFETVYQMEFTTTKPVDSIYVDTKTYKNNDGFIDGYTIVEEKAEELKTDQNETIVDNENRIISVY